MMRSGIRLGIAVLVALGLTGTAFAQTAEPITNDDVVMMVQAGLSASIILSVLESANSARFDLSPEGLIALNRTGVDERVTRAMMAVARRGREGESALAATRNAPEKSALLAAASEPADILRSFRTLSVDASSAEYFRTDQMKAALGAHKGFDALGITIVDDRAVADVVLLVGYTFAWDYPFSLSHQNTSMVLLSGKGVGPFSGPSGAASVAGHVPPFCLACHLSLDLASTSRSVETTVKGVKVHADVTPIQLEDIRAEYCI